MAQKLLLVLSLCSSSSAFVAQMPIEAKRRFDDSCPAKLWNILKASKTSWSAADNWDGLSSEHPENAVQDSSDIFNQDIASKAAKAMQDGPTAHEVSEEDAFVRDTVDVIHHHGFYFEPSASDPKLYDTGFEDYTKTINFIDDVRNASKTLATFLCHVTLR